MPHISTASLNDLDSLTLLFDQYRVFYRKPSHLDSARKFLKERLTNKESIIYLAKDEQGKCLGFVQLYPLFSSVQMKRLWQLNDLFVDPEFRGKGISKQLIDRAKQLAIETEACGLLLETEASNVIGNQLYPSAGFSRVDQNYFYYWENPTE